MGSVATTTTLAVGVSGGDEGALTAGQAMLVSAPDSSEYLVWQATRLRLNKQGGAVTALGYVGRAPVPVSAAFLDALPAGPDLTAPTVPGVGGAGPSLGGHATRLGQVFRIGVVGSAPRYYQLRENGLAEVSVTVADLLLGDPAIRHKVYAGRAVTAVTLPPDVLNGHLVTATDAAGVLPDSPPRLVDRQPGRSPCVRVQPSGAGPRVSVALADVAALGTVAQAVTGGACVPVDQITVPAGGGALVRALAADGGTAGGTHYLVTDTGTKYRVPSASDLAALGYSAAQAVALPSPLLAMLPTGPDLSAQAASSGISSTTTPPCAGTRKAATS
jgi:type VII secretion protein EccB